MTPEEAERYLLSLELFGMRFGLDRMRRLMTALDHPERRFHSIHVVGTNGKSSTVRMIAAILAAHGLRTGSYLSPHLVSFTERIRIDDEDLDPAAFGAAVARAARAAELVDRSLTGDDRVTQFEALTAAAYSELAAVLGLLRVASAGRAVAEQHRGGLPGLGHAHRVRRRVAGDEGDLDVLEPGVTVGVGVQAGDRHHRRHHDTQ